MIIHDVRTNEVGCLIIRKKTIDYVKSPKQFNKISQIISFQFDIKTFNKNI